MSDSQSGRPGFESRSEHNLDLGSLEFKSSATLVNRQLVCLRPVGILNNVMLNLKYLFQLFARPRYHCAIETLPRLNIGYVLSTNISFTFQATPNPSTKIFTNVLRFCVKFGVIFGHQFSERDIFP